MNEEYKITLNKNEIERIIIALKKYNDILSDAKKHIEYECGLQGGYWIFENIEEALKEINELDSELKENIEIIYKIKCMTEKYKNSKNFCHS